MNSYLIPYLDPKKNNGEEDPLFSEYTYGDKGNRGEILKTMVSKGDFLFFHRSIGRKLYITAFYEVEKILGIQKARMDNTIMVKYRNHHLFNNKVQENEVIVFGNPDKSVILDTPLEVNRELLLELSIPYNPSLNQTELGALSSKFRTWFLLTESQVRLILQKANPLYNESFLELEKELSSSIVLGKTEKELITKARIGQSIFKRELLAGERKCKLCGVSDERFLVASHIKPWSQSNHKERLDVNNGLLLCPNHDALFDKGYISFDEDGSILISDSLDADTKIFLNINENMKIRMNDRQQRYMKWHREDRFENAK
ncbi:restriction endonuclease [Bacillus cereus]|uniref:HNH endonuclease n=1 Tax=Bacillus cereus TaxID=1396 RepID=UPI000BED7E09|nr:HNH endonuclease signature motif containing protein [Bacillus cereus]MDF3554659.1 HNH endonuclease [Bacillus cereus]PEC30699.1 restriction endonuclease [Bacillus cereus]PEY41083.1 restriction endonuclease [Bacillus cereus]PFJ73690.1 restriction endonuclease [Bacillus cereus]PFP18921.1 restriction endonuclease [Bacillus cereus]